MPAYIRPGSSNTSNIARTIPFDRIPRSSDVSCCSYEKVEQRCLLFTLTLLHAKASVQRALIPQKHILNGLAVKGHNSHLPECKVVLSAMCQASLLCF